MTSAVNLQFTGILENFLTYFTVVFHGPQWSVRYGLVGKVGKVSYLKHDDKDI